MRRILSDQAEATALRVVAQSAGDDRITVVSPVGPERLQLIAAVLERARKMYADRDIEILGGGKIRIGTTVVEFATGEEEAERKTRTVGALHA